MTSAAPGTSRPTRRIAAISWVTVSWVATASVRIVESSTRRVLPASTPVAATTSRTASKIRFGWCEAANRGRHQVSTVGWSAVVPIGHPTAAFHRRSNVSASPASRSERCSSACSTSTEATTSPGTLGRPNREGNRSANIASGNSSRRCSARNAYTLPGGNRAASDSTSITTCSGWEVPCTTPIVAPNSPSKTSPTTRDVQQAPSEPPRPSARCRRPQSAARHDVVAQRRRPRRDLGERRGELEHRHAPGPEAGRDVAARPRRAPTVVEQEGEFGHRWVVADDGDHVHLLRRLPDGGEQGLSSVVVDALVEDRLRVGRQRRGGLLPGLRRPAGGGAGPAFGHHPSRRDPGADRGRPPRALIREWPVLVDGAGGRLRVADQQESARLHYPSLTADRLRTAPVPLPSPPYRRLYPRLRSAWRTMVGSRHADRQPGRGRRPRGPRQLDARLLRRQARAHAGLRVRRSAALRSHGRRPALQPTVRGYAVPG